VTPLEGARVSLVHSERASEQHRRMKSKRPMTNEVLPSTAYFADFAMSYNGHIDDLLHQLMEQTGLREIHDFVGFFYTHLNNRPDSAAILSRLSSAELEELKSRQLQHLQLVFSRGTTPQAHYERALHVGWVHEMVGVSVPMLMEAYHLYHSKVEEILSTAILNSQQRDELRAAIHQRLQLDIEAQTAIQARFGVKIGSLQAALDDAIQKAGNLADLLRNSLQALGDFDGVSACLLARPDAQGVMQIEAEGGEEGSRYAESLRLKRVPPFEIDAAAFGGNGPSGRAWRSAQIQINDSFQVEATMQPWRAEAEKRGFRSSAAVPLLDESGQSFAILSLYSGWPGFFSAVTRIVMLRHVQQTMSHAILRLEQTVVIPSDLRHTYRQYLEDGAVEMLYQPIIDLRTGKLDSLEALARLRGEGGQLIPPAAFLSAFGKSGLLRLFRLGLEQVCRDSQMWHEQNPHQGLLVALNLPPDGLTQDAYRDSVFEMLSRWNVPPAALALEILETKESLDIGKRDARIAEFQKAGIRIAQDDLGSGHSSLMRMDRLPSDHVKIDQALVRGTLKRPVRALEFIYHLTLLAQGFGAQVTVEGLEDEGLIEAATILGADHGQGYGIARPMPTHEVMPWNQTWSFPVDPEQPKTALGALAGYLLWDHKLGTLSDWPEFAAQFIQEPWLVHRYLKQSGNSDSDLPMMLERTQIVALKGQRSAKYKQMRKELIERLGEIWLNERK
jgi:EAL domain-containing protein (putative c-di-GMP-specific phosphodiesterase class I)